MKKNLTETIKSVSSQTEDSWRAVIVANHGADIPKLPSQFEVNWVDFPPNSRHERGQSTMGEFYEAVRIDKGRRVLSGLLHAKPVGHVMILDDDDLVSNGLAAHVSKNPDSNGWNFFQGYVWPDGGTWMYLYDEFHQYCGSSHIIRSDLLKIPATFSQATTTYISRTLGSHIYIDEDLSLSGNPLVPLPFVGGVYRIGHAGAHSKSKGLFRRFFLNRSALREPIRTLAGISRLKPVNKTVRQEFFG